jgi:hypothetical protein|nr:MAG TPA: hypothetical protein [Caudoviricetes sp.]
MKRKGYKDIQKQIEANERYLENNPDAKVKANRSRVKSTCHRFIREFATVKELKNIKELIETREETMEKMTKEKWEKVAEKIKGKTYVNNDCSFGWQGEINAECETENPILFGDIEKWSFHEDTRFVQCYEEDGEAGYLFLEIEIKYDEDDGGMIVTIVDAIHKG